VVNTVYPLVIDVKALPTQQLPDAAVAKTPVLMWLMKTLLTSGCVNQRGAGHKLSFRECERFTCYLTPEKYRLMQYLPGSHKVNGLFCRDAYTATAGLING
jgi:hypothetical protein